MYLHSIDTIQDFLCYLGIKSLMHLCSENIHFSTRLCYRQTYQNYEGCRQKLGTFLEKKEQFKNQSFLNISLIKMGFLFILIFFEEKNQKDSTDFLN